ncbi:unnamed protein product, partial [Adineta ricciae]
KYKQKMTKRTIFIIIGCIWLISVLLSYGPVLLGLYSEKTDGHPSDSSECRMRPNRIYSIISSFTSFYIPLIIILFLYGRIFITARKHSHELQKLESIIKRLHSDEKFVLESAKWNRNLKAIRTLGINFHVNCIVSTCLFSKGIVVGVFVLCWLPFFIMYLRLAYCDYTCLNDSLERYITWIGYANSFCNPMIYAFSNKDFRNAFFEILHYNNCQCCTLSSRNKMRTSISKSTHSMNTKFTPQAQSRHASMTPYLTHTQRNGNHICDTKIVPKTVQKPAVSREVDTYELQTIANQLSTMEVFRELEYLVSNELPCEATISEVSSLLCDRDESIDEVPEKSCPKPS